MKRLAIFIGTICCFISTHAEINQDSAFNIAQKVATDSVSEIWLSNQQYTQGVYTIIIDYEDGMKTHKIIR